MEEINLDFEKDSHKTVNFNNLTPSTGGVNVIRDKKDVDIGLDLLINKSKVGGDSPKPVEEFKPSDPIKPRTPSPQSLSVTLDNTPSFTPRPSVPVVDVNTTSFEKELDLSDIGITDFPQSNNSGSNISSTINLGNQNDELKDLDLNLESLLSENDTQSAQQNTPPRVASPVMSLSGAFDQEPRKSFEELQKEKAEFIRLLERLEQRGFRPHKKFTMDSDYNEVKAEFDRITRQRECDQSIKFQRKMLVAFITAIEFLNNKFDPIDLKLDGWGESIHENINDYDDVFEELHEKYKGKSQMAPELKLLLMVGGSGFMFHLTNTMFKSAIPGMGDVMRQNPDLMSQFAKAAASSMGSMGGENAGFGNLMGDVLGGGMGGGRNTAPPPPQARRREMDGPPDISDILNNMSNNQNVNVDLNSGFSESEVETSHGTRKHRTLDLNI
tara:strand:- start:97 stop:1419 length:1323 start_codon:yes stop_codon:yes gene_type:complete